VKEGGGGSEGRETTKTKRHNNIERRRDKTSRSNNLLITEARGNTRQEYKERSLPKEHTRKEKEGE